MTPQPGSAVPGAPAPTADWGTYRRLGPFLKTRTRGLIFVMTLSLFSTALGLVQPYVSRLLIDKALLQHDMKALVSIAGIMLAAAVFGYLLNIAASYRYIRLSASMLFDMRVTLFRHLQTLSPRFFSKFRLGDLLSRLNNDVSEVQRVAADTVLSVLNNVVFFIGSVAMMLWLNWRLFVVSVILVPLALSSFRHFQKKLTLLTRTLRERSADLGSLFVDSMLGMRVVVSLGAGEHEAERFRARNDAFVDTMLEVQMASFLATALPGTVLSAATAAVFIYGGWLIFRGEMTIGTMVAFMAYHSRLMSPVQTLMSMTAGLASARASLARIFELLDTPAEVQDAPDAVALVKPKGSIRLEDVYLSYDRDPVLRGVTVEIPAGSYCAVVGTSGAGKSTMADLIARNLDPDSGRVLLDGMDVKKIRLADLRREVMLMEQAPYLFHATIAENISFAMPQATREDIERAAKVAGLEELVRRLPRGLDTVAGERGLALSAGERQRVSLARAVLRRPTVMILDEPTSALDGETERMIAMRLRSALPDATLIVITHRPALADGADLVIHVAEGRATVGDAAAIAARLH